MRIAVLGTGDVGQTLASGFIATGHSVRMGARSADNEKMLAWAARSGPEASVGTFADAAQYGDVIVLATLGEANASVIRMADPARFAGKVVIDTTNPLDFSSGAPVLATGHTNSGAEEVQRLVPGASVVKAFNSIGFPLMFKPQLPGGPPDMFICGNEAEAKRVVGGICEQFGWGVVDVGPLESARYLEALAMIWIMRGTVSGSWNHAFKLLR